MTQELYDQTITVWNCLKGTDHWGEDTWYPTVINSARLIVTKGNNIMRSGLSEADSARLHISDTISVPERPYIDPVQWRTHPADYYTLESENHSFFTQGDSSDEVPELYDDFFEQMRKIYYRCFRITSVDRYEVIPHFEVWGK